MKIQLKTNMLFISILILLIISNVSAKDFSSSIQKLAGENAEKYVMPLIEGFSSGLNTGLYNKASVAPGKLIPVGFDIGFCTMFAMVPEDKTNFAYNLSENSILFPLGSLNDDLEDINLSFMDIYNSNSDETPTIAGDGKGVRFIAKNDNEIYDAVKSELIAQGVSSAVIDNNSTEIQNYINSNLSGKVPNFQFPDGLGVAGVPAIALQANVRLPFIGLEVSGRYLPEIKMSSDIGKFKMYGLGLRKSIPIPIVDVTAGVFYHKIKTGNILDVNSMNYHIEIGKSIGIPFLLSFSPYAGVSMSSTKAELKYTIENDVIPGMDSQDFKYDIELDNDFAFNLGLTAQIVPLTYLNVDYKQGDYSAVAIRFGLILK